MNEYIIKDNKIAEVTSIAKKENWVLMNEDTGEVIDLNGLELKSKKKVMKSMVDYMLKNASSKDDVDMKLLYTWCKLTGNINDWGQIKLKGEFISTDYFNLSKEDVLLFGYSARLIELANNYTNILMKNHKTSVKTWAEIYEAIGVSKKSTQSKLKKFFEKYDLVRKVKAYKNVGDKQAMAKYVLNPFIIRKGSFVSQFTLAVFSDCVSEGKNIDDYAFRFLSQIGILN